MKKVINTDIIQTIMGVVFSILAVISFLFLSSNPFDETNEETKFGKSLDDGLCSYDDVIVYQGAEVTPSFTLEYEGNELIEGVDYSVRYFNNVHPGTATFILNGLGDYTGAKLYTFSIIYDDPVCDDPENSELVDYVNSWFDVYLDRFATRDELLYLVNSIYDGVFSSDDLIEYVVNNSDFNTDRFADDEFVFYMYSTFLHRAADEYGFEAWMMVLSDPSIDRRDVLATFVGSSEFIDYVNQYSSDYEPELED